MEVTSVSPTTFPNYFNRVEYDTRLVKTTVRINDNQQQEIVYTYDKYGRLLSSAVNAKTIAEV